MKTKSIACLCFFVFLSSFFTSLHIFCQEIHRSISIIPDNRSVYTNVRAIIIGISKYKNLPFENQLNYADDDAIALDSLLCRHPGIKKENIWLYINENANQPAILGAFSMMTQEVEQGDLVIIYFGGHGDVSRKVENDGFFLLYHAYCDKDGDYYESDVIQFQVLKEFISELAKRKVNVLLITDACRSGKILDETGSELTLTALLQEWQNTAKLTSCQPDELSEEGPQWGFGHGVFTFYLLQGMEGFSDNDTNGQIVLVELYNYLKQHVTHDTYEKSISRPRQTPKYSGNDYFGIIDVDTGLFKNAQEKSQAQNYLMVQNLPGISTAKGIIVNSSVESKILNKFSQAISEPKLIIPENHGLLEDSIKANYTEDPQILNTVVNQIRFSHGGDIFAMALNKLGFPGSKSIIIKDSKTYETLKSLNGNRNGSTCIVFSRDDKKIACAGNDHQVFVYDLASGEPVSTFYNKSSNILYMVFSSDNSKIITGESSNNISVYDLKTGKKDKNLLKNTSRLNSLISSPDGNFITSCSMDKEIHLWDASDLKSIEVLHLKEFSAISLTFSDDNKMLYYVDEKNDLYKYAIDTKRTERLISLPSSGYRLYRKIYVLPDNKHLFIHDKGYSDFLFVNTETRSITKIDITESSFGFSNCNSYSSEANLFIEFKLQQKRLVYWTFDFPLPYAEETYRILSEIVTDNDEIELIQTSLIIALQKAAYDIIEPFILGKDFTPTHTEIREAIRQVEFAMNIAGNDSIILKNLLAKKLFLQGYEIMVSNSTQRYNEAIDYFQQILVLKPEASYPFNAIALIKKKQNDLKQSEEELKTSIHRVPKWSEPKSNLGKVFIRGGKYDIAQNEFNKIIKINPTKSLGYTNMGDLHVLMGEYPEAETFYKTSLHVDTTNPSIYIRCGDLCALRGRFNEAFIWYTRAIELANKPYPGALRAFARLYLTIFCEHDRDTSNIVKAFEYSKQAFIQDDLNPDMLNTFIHTNLVAAEYLGIPDLSLYIKSSNNPMNKQEDESVFRRKYSELKQLGDKSISLDPFREESYLLMALNEIILNGNRENALEYLNKALIQCKAYPVCYVNYGLFYAHFKEWEKAILWYEKAMDIDSRYLPAYTNMFSALSKIRSIDKLNELEINAQRFFGSNVLISYYLAIARFSLKDKPKALTKINESLHADSNFAFAVSCKANMLGISRKNISNNGSEIQIPYKQVNVSINKVILELSATAYIADITGRIIMPTYYKKIRPVRQGYVVGNNVKFGWINESNVLTVPVEYDDIYLLGIDLVIAKKNGSYGAFDFQGNLLIPFEYSSITDGQWSKKPTACCHKGNERYFYNEKGDFVGKNKK